MARTAGSVEITVDFKWSPKTISEWPATIKYGILEMAFDTANQARMRAPYVTGALKNSIRVDTSHDPDVLVIAGGSSSWMSTPPKGAKTIYRFVNYADKREKGPNRNPATEHYMEYAKDDIMAGNWQQKYFRNLKGVK